MARRPLLLTLVTTCLLSCVTANVSPPPPPLPADGAALLASLAADPVPGWGLFPGRRERTIGSGFHGESVTVRVNRVAGDGLRARSRRLPAGAVIACEGFSAAGDPTGLVLMAKIAGYAPEDGDWFWLACDPGGAILAQGRPGDCVECHRRVRGNDLVFTGPVR